MDTKTDNLTSLTDLAKILGLTRSQITTKVDKGEIPVVIVGGRMMVESTAVAFVIPEKTQFEKMTGRRAEDLPRLLTVDQTAKLLGVSRRTAYRAVASGEIASVKVGCRRVPLVEVARLLGA
jgi:excisionase family DNA binding protein